MKMRRQNLFVPMAMLSLASCQQAGSLDSSLSSLQNDLNKTVSQLTSPLSKPSATALTNTTNSGTPAINNTPLYNLFVNHPYNTNNPFKEQYPRVALKILALPPHPEDTWEIYQGDHMQVPTKCFTLSATIWNSQTSSTQVAPFQECFPNQNVWSKFSGIALTGVGDWDVKVGFSLYDEQSTGSVRTDGPIPPDTPFPMGPFYQKLYAGAPQPIGMTYFGAMMTTLLLEMDFNYEISADRRVWVVSIAGTQPN